MKHSRHPSFLSAAREKDELEKSPFSAAQTVETQSARRGVARKINNRQVERKDGCMQPAGQVSAACCIL